jgi:excisionase family DNA binding protein
MSCVEAAAYLGRSPAWVRERVKDGRLPARFDGSRFVIPRVQLDAWLLEATIGPRATTVARHVALGVPSPKGRRG